LNWKQFNVSKQWMKKSTGTNYQSSVSTGAAMTAEQFETVKDAMMNNSTTRSLGISCPQQIEAPAKKPKLTKNKKHEAFRKKSETPSDEEQARLKDEAALKEAIKSQLLSTGAVKKYIDGVRAEMAPCDVVCEKLKNRGFPDTMGMILKQSVTTWLEKLQRVEKVYMDVLISEAEWTVERCKNAEVNLKSDKDNFDLEFMVFKKKMWADNKRIGGLGSK
jgi:hypothetical protein